MGELKGSREMLCPRCGRMHMVEADYFTPGINGTAINSKGVPVIFVDPTEPHLCDTCFEELLDEITALDESEIELYI